MKSEAPGRQAVVGARFLGLLAFMLAFRFSLSRDRISKAQLNKWFSMKRTR